METDCPNLQVASDAVVSNASRETRREMIRVANKRITENLIVKPTGIKKFTAILQSKG